MADPDHRNYFVTYTLCQILAIFLFPSFPKINIFQEEILHWETIIQINEINTSMDKHFKCMC